MSEADPADLFTAYAKSFADRPGFVEPEPAVWLGELDLDPDWRRDLSLLALHKAHSGGLHQRSRALGGPGRRGAGLARPPDGGATWSPGPSAPWPSRARSRSGLCVNVNNPAGELYRRLGFADAGTRARYTREVRRA